MKSTDRREVVVIGGGIVGCAIALHLADRGVLPVLVDTDRPGQGASRRSFASISAFGKDPVSYYDLAGASMASWSRWAERLGGNVGLRRDGEVRWTADPGEGRALGERVAQARRWGYPIMPIGEAELRRLLPAAEPGPVAAACHAPYDGQVEPARVLGACHSALQAAGARLLLGRAARVRVDDDGVRVEVGDQVLRPATTILAAGAEAVEVAAAIGLDVPMVASPGMLVETRPVPALTDKVVYLPGDPGPPVHLRQRPDGSMLVGERSQETIAAHPTQKHARVLLDQAARFFPALRGVPVERWTLAWRAMPADRLPIVGPLPGFPRCTSPSPTAASPWRRSLAAWSVRRSPTRCRTACWGRFARAASPSGQSRCCSRSSRPSATDPAPTGDRAKTGGGGDPHESARHPIAATARRLGARRKRDTVGVRQGLMLIRDPPAIA